MAIGLKQGDKIKHKTYGKGEVIDATLSRKGSVHASFVKGPYKKYGWIRVAKRELTKI